MAKTTYGYLGKTGLKVSNICLGTMTFGDVKNGAIQCSEEDSYSILDRFAARGGNFIDTADVYAGGNAEKILGNWLSKQDRKRFVISTKCFNFSDATDPNSGGLSRKHIMDAVSRSLERLQTDYIDLFQIHIWDDGTPIEESMGTLNDLVSQGKIRYIGVSNVTGWQLQKIVDICKARGWNDVVALQQHWSLLCRFSEFAEYQVARLEGVGVLAWSPLKGGLLSGKYQRGQPLPEDSRITDLGKSTSEAYPIIPADSGRFWDLVDTLRDISGQAGVSVSQVAIRWVLQQDITSSVIIGVRTLSQLEENMDAASDTWTLSPEQMNRLDEASRIQPPYPYNMIAQFNTGRQH